jgi:hypothetical protein
MENTVFNLMSYTYHVGRELRTARTFSQSGLPGMKAEGRIKAPPGSQLRTGHGPTRLLVPKPGRESEYNVFTAEAAAEHAIKGDFGLSLETETGDTG